MVCERIANQIYIIWILIYIKDRTIWNIEVIASQHKCHTTLPLALPSFVSQKDYITTKVAKEDGFIQQLASKYSKECLSPSEKILKEQIDSENRDAVQKKRKCNVLNLIDSIGAEIIPAESLPFYKDDLYFNMNRTEDYNLLLEKISLADQNQN